MFERFTDRSRKVMALANQEAQRFNHEYIGTEHILLGLIEEGSGVGANVLKNLGVDLQQMRVEVEKLVKPGPKSLIGIGKLPQTPHAKKVIQYAIEEARSLNHNYVGTEHLLLGLLREQDGVAAQVLMNLGLKLEVVREEVLNLLGVNVESDPSVQQQRTWAPGASSEQTSAVLVRAIEEAHRLRHAYVGTEHLLLALASTDPALMGKLGLDEASIRREVARIVSPGNAPVAGAPLKGPTAQRVFHHAHEEAQNPKLVDSKHLLLGLLAEPDSVAAVVLRNLGFDLDELRKKVLELPE